MAISALDVSSVVLGIVALQYTAISVLFNQLLPRSEEVLSQRDVENLRSEVYFAVGGSFCCVLFGVSFLVASAAGYLQLGFGLEINGFLRRAVAAIGIFFLLAGVLLPMGTAVKICFTLFRRESGITIRGFVLNRFSIPTSENQESTE